MSRQIINEKYPIIRERFTINDCGTNFITLTDHYIKQSYNEMILFEYNEKNGLYFMHYEKGSCFPFVGSSLSANHRIVFNKMMIGARVGHKHHYAVYDETKKAYKYIGEDEETATKIFAG